MGGGILIILGAVTCVFLRTQELSQSSSMQTGSDYDIYDLNSNIAMTKWHTEDTDKHCFGSKRRLSLSLSRLSASLAQAQYHLRSTLLSIQRLSGRIVTLQNTNLILSVPTPAPSPEIEEDPYSQITSLFNQTYHYCQSAKNAALTQWNKFKDHEHLYFENSLKSAWTKFLHSIFSTNIDPSISTLSSSLNAVGFNFSLGQSGESSTHCNYLLDQLFSHISYLSDSEKSKDIVSTVNPVTNVLRSIQSKQQQGASEFIKLTAQQSSFEKLILHLKKLVAYTMDEMKENNLQCEMMDKSQSLRELIYVRNRLINSNKVSLVKSASEIVDCEVSDWTETNGENDCELQMDRSVLVYPNTFGVKCPHLTLTVDDGSCEKSPNSIRSKLDSCDDIKSDWTEWTQCDDQSCDSTALSFRWRSVPSSSEISTLNLQCTFFESRPCDKPSHCVKIELSEKECPLPRNSKVFKRVKNWSECSRMCGGGSTSCFKPSSRQKVYALCNTHTCPEEPIEWCRGGSSTADKEAIIFLLDYSASVQFKKFSRNYSHIIRDFVQKWMVQGSNVENNVTRALNVSGELSKYIQSLSVTTEEEDEEKSDTPFSYGLPQIERIFGVVGFQLGAKWIVNMTADASRFEAVEEAVNPAAFTKESMPFSGSSVNPTMPNKQQIKPPSFIGDSRSAFDLVRKMYGTNEQPPYFTTLILLTDGEKNVAYPHTLVNFAKRKFGFDRLMVVGLVKNEAKADYSAFKILRNLASRPAHDNWLFSDSRGDVASLLLDRYCSLRYPIPK